MEGQTMTNMPLVRGLGSEDATLTKEVNTTNAYFWMLNRYNVKVPIAVGLEANCLKRGFVHTDRKIYSDDMSKQVQAPAPVSPLEAVAKMAEKMSENSEITAQVLEEVTGVKRKKKAKSTETLEKLEADAS